MDGTEFGNLLDWIGQMIEKSTPKEAEYWQGYCQGIKFYYRGGRITVRDHYHLRKIADMASSDPYRVANLCGYRDGCDGKKPQDTTQAHGIPPEREEVAG